jgi:hypothetical protein
MRVSSELKWGLAANWQWWLGANCATGVISKLSNIGKQRTERGLAANWQQGASSKLATEVSSEQTVTKFCASIKAGTIGGSGFYGSRTSSAG